MDPVSNVRKMPCPSEAVWARLVTGAIPVPEAESLLVHASECPECAATLRSSIDALAEDGESDSDDWPAVDVKELASSIARAQPQPVPRRALLPSWAVVAAALTVSLAGVWWFVAQQGRSSSIAQLEALAAAYPSPRTLEFRITGTKFAKLQARRGAGPGEPNPEVLEAQAKILKVTKAREPSADWLHAKGRAELLQREFVDAVRSLQLSADLGANSTEFWNDFGIAYAERASSTATPIDYTRAIELFTASLKVDPKNRSALYNRALAQSRLSLLDGAIRDLEKCISLEPDADWRDEAAALLETLRHKRSSIFENPQPLSPALLVESTFERLMRDALPPGETQALAVLMQTTHRDTWLSEALAVPPSSVNQRAVYVLSRLARIRAKSKREEYSSWATEINWLDSVPLPDSLSAWRDFELLVRASNRRDSVPCAVRVAHVDHMPERFRWFTLQSALEMSTCFTAQGNLDAAAEATSKAIAIADKAGYGTGFARAQGFLGSHYVNEGRYREAIEVSATVLQQILEGAYPLDRAHQHYRNLAASAERLGRFGAASEAIGMSVAVAHHTGLASLELFGWMALADLRLRDGDGDAAASHMRRANVLAASLRLDPEADLYRSFAEAQQASIKGDYAGATRPIHQLLASKNLFVDTQYLPALAELELRLQQPDAALDHARALILELAAQPADKRRFRAADAQASRILVEAHLALRDERSALAAWREWRQRDRALFGGFPTSNPERPDTVVVALVPLGNKLGIFQQFGESLEFRWSTLPASQLLGLVRRLRALCANPISDPSVIEALSENISVAILQDCQSCQGKPVQWEAIDEWMTIPLMALPPHGRPASASFRVPLSKRAGCEQRRDGLVLAQADRIHTRYQSVLPPLPALDRELQMIRNSAPVTLVLTGDQATPHALLAAARSHRWFHFSGHALRDKNSTVLLGAPDPSALVPDERIGLWRLRSDQHLCSDGVFFAACSTGAFHETETVSPSQLADAALMAGAQWSIAALWDVDSEATTELSAHFYAALGSGLSPALSLSQAAEQLRRDPRYRHPYYWAAFVLFEG